MIQEEFEEYDDSPTPEQIKERSLEIRKKWSVKEHYKRAGLAAPEPYVVPTVPIDTE
jgi:hypothetical protein